MPVERIAREVVLQDGPYQGTRFVLDRLQDTLLIADVPLDPPDIVIDAWDPPVPVAVYELATEYIGADGEREGIYLYGGHRHPRRHPRSTVPRSPDSPPESACTDLR